MNREQIDAVVQKICSMENPDAGSDRVKVIYKRFLTDIFNMIEDLDISSEEIWTFVDWLTRTGKGNEFGLVAAGTGLEHFIDLRMDEAEEKAGIVGGTPRTIEGPLYVSGAPETLGYAELETEPEEGGERLYMQGTVYDENGNPVEGALVEVWHCNLKGLYSYFDTSQPDFNLRRSIRTGKDGKYKFKSFLPVGYSCPPHGTTQELLDLLGRHGDRPAHIHFFVTKDGFRKLTTQINIEDDPLVGNDFAFADRDGLVPPITRISLAEAQEKYGIDEPFASIDFDFEIHRDKEGIFDTENNRPRVELRLVNS